MSNIRGWDYVQVVTIQCQVVIQMQNFLPQKILPNNERLSQICLTFTLLMVSKMVIISSLFYVPFSDDTCYNHTHFRTFHKSFSKIHSAFFSLLHFAFRYVFRSGRVIIFQMKNILQITGISREYLSLFAFLNAIILFVRQRVIQTKTNLQDQKRKKEDFSRVFTKYLVKVKVFS